MRRYLPTALCGTAFAFLSLTAAAQDRFVYAITDASKEGAGWNMLRRLDLGTGSYSDVLLNGIVQPANVFDHASKKPLTLQPDARYGNLMMSPFSTGVAAAAYDKRHNRLYFTPMFIDQLRYIDLRTMKVYYVADKSFTTMGSMHNDEGKIITRMVIAPDGYGYAISNDGNTFIRFSTGRKTEIEQLGALADDPANGAMSIHSRCSSFGGDMIADEDGNLFIISARNQVFRINTETKLASHIASLKGLPATFTANGAAVNDEGQLLVSSAVDNSAYFVVDPKSWTAAPYKIEGGMFRSSDLANGNFLPVARKTAPEITKPAAGRVNATERFAQLISVYPNPVTANQVTLSFTKVPAGDYTIELTDVMGRSVMVKRVVVNGEAQTQSLPLNPGYARGTYLVKVMDKEQQSVFSQKVLLQ